MTARRKNYGWIPDLPDHRDLYYSAPARIHLPERVDLRPNVVEIYDQGDLGACTANALCAAFQFIRKLEGEEAWRPSRLFVYFGEREIEDTVAEDAGAMLRDGIKFMAKRGVCPESQGTSCWPYDIAQFTTRPRPDCYVEAEKNQVLRYQRVMPSVASMKSVLAQGRPFVVGIGIFDSFESEAVAATGEVPMPGQEESLLGGHAVTVVGYDDATQRFRLLNSWGDTWGDRGFFTLPYSYLANPNLADDRWVISRTE